MRECSSNNVFQTYGWHNPPKVQLIGRAVTETRGEEYIDERGFQLCGAYLDEETEIRRYVDELDAEVSVGPDTCKSLLDVASDQGRVSEFNLYERP